MVPNRLNPMPGHRHTTKRSSNSLQNFFLNKIALIQFAGWGLMSFTYSLDFALALCWVTLTLTRRYDDSYEKHAKNKKRLSIMYLNVL